MTRGGPPWPPRFVSASGRFLLRKLSVCRRVECNLFIANSQFALQLTGTLPHEIAMLARHEQSNLQ